MKVLEKLFDVVLKIITIGVLLIGIIKFLQLSKQANDNIMKVEYTHEDCYEYYINHKEQYQ